MGNGMPNEIATCVNVALGICILFLKKTIMEISIIVLHLDFTHYHSALRLFFSVNIIRKKFN